MAGTARKNDPELWDRVKAEVTAGDKGGHPGQWSARKAQLATAQYKEAGGTYAGPKQPDNHLSQWTREEWGTRSGKPSGETNERYLPAKARKSLSKDEYDRSTAAKRRDSAAGKQFSRQPADVAAKAARARRPKDGSKQPPSRGARRRSMDDTAPQDHGPKDGTNEAWTEFRGLVNMPADAMREWLDTEDSRSVGWTHEGEAEAVGHQSGRRILELLERDGPPADGDAVFLRKVVGYIQRHSAQRPDGDVTETRWRYSLMNWGHDPLRKTAPGTPKRRAPAPRGQGRPARSAKATGATRRSPAATTKRASAGATSKRASAGATTWTTGTAKARGTGTAAKRTTSAATKRPAAKRATAGTTKRATGATAKRTTGNPQKRVAAKPPAKRQAGTAAKRASGATPKRVSADGAAKRGTRAATARGAAGRTAAAAKGGRTRAGTPRRP